jgi:protein ImuB
MTLAATLAEPTRTKADDLLADTEEPEADVSDLIDTLANRVGEKQLYRIASGGQRRAGALRPEDRAIGAARRRGMAGPLAASSPASMPRPEPIETVALLPDHPPVSFTWRGVRRRVKCADGPERVFGEWWKLRRRTDPRSATIFSVEDEAGERFWIYRSGDGEDTTTGSQRWFLHGIFG